MLKFISLTMIALVSFSPLASAAPTHFTADVSEPIIANIKAMPMSWKRKEPQVVDAKKFLRYEISKFMNEKGHTKRDGSIFDLIAPQTQGEAPIIDFEGLFRGVFDKVIDHIIEVTPLNDIVHGNYDFLYDIFTSMVQEVITNVGTGIENIPVNSNPFDLFAIPESGTDALPALPALPAFPNLPDFPSFPAFPSLPTPKTTDLEEENSNSHYHYHHHHHHDWNRDDSNSDRNSDFNYEGDE